MTPQVYDGNIHPDEWLKQFNTYCFLKNITTHNVKFAKMMIDSTINIPKDATSLTEIISALKTDVSFTIFKNTNKRKLQALKYKSENVGGNTAKFIDTFRKLCRDAEIDDLNEQKKNFIETLSYALKNKFLDKIDDENIESLNDIFLRFNNILIEPTININIKDGSIIALKHVATGKYLSTIENLRYETESNSQMVFLGDSELNSTSLWKIQFDKEYATTDTFITFQHLFDKFLGIRYRNNNRRDYYKSPSGNTEVSCNVIKGNDNNNKWRFDLGDLKNQGYLKSNDIITLSIKNERLIDQFQFLRGHDFHVTSEDETYFEVICHDKAIGAHDNWCIELIE
ncbi:hypothetical protein RclHR1_19440001 [Rhizophagus clarus]|uniref:MIR domain-containing protein n=1 Tax=Rhizophagus clarus TaxID=94130 RepID=A0A2Z6QPG2_9GLOM|nr:hypothetical protein RclHR1_19440001 [Rhizophagus clarus]GES94981.1 hypothetical protein GLOIN_2v1544040 [Rhizophagus clarus]